MKPEIPGPAPWFLRNCTFRDFVWEQAEFPKFLLDKKGGKIVGVEICAYVKKLSEEKILLWFENEKKQRIEIAKINLLEADPIVGKANNKYAGGLFNNRKFLKYEIATRLGIGCHKIPTADLDNLCMIADFTSLPKEFKGPEMKRAVYDANFREGKLKIVNLKWFNEDGRIDFGYQWVARIDKIGEDTYCGDGVRINPFTMNDKGELL